MSEETGEPKTSSSSKKPSATKGDGKKTLIAWANQKNNLGSAVGAAMRLNLRQTDKMTESEYDKAIEKYRKMPPPRIK